MRTRCTILARLLAPAAFAGMLTLALAAGFGSGGSARAQEGEVVVVGGYNLHPRDLVVQAGEPVTFQVQEREDPSMTHTLVALGGAFESPPLQAGETWSVTLSEPGVYRYRLEERPSVEGTIVVE